ncbi:MAG: redox-sensitive transcriptional activator SoxR [Hyphomonadaceae bacterium]
MAGHTIGKLATRTGLSTSAIRFYEAKGLIKADRNKGGQRRFAPSDIRRLSFIMITQQQGFTLGEIADMLGGLPNARTPTEKDWAKISKRLHQRIDERITQLEHMRKNLDGCIGCGCLSLKKCALYNPDDRISIKGAGPRYLMGDRSSDPLT